MKRWIGISTLTMFAIMSFAGDTLVPKEKEPIMVTAGDESEKVLPQESNCTTACTLVTKAYNNLQSVMNTLYANQCDGYSIDAYYSLESALGNLGAAANTLCNAPGSCIWALMRDGFDYTLKKIDRAGKYVDRASCLGSLQSSLAADISSIYATTSAAKSATSSCCP